MARKVIEIDELKCIGCGRCAEACSDGAIELVNGKARLMRADSCDGFGQCLPVCPKGAIRFTERAAAAFDEEVARAHIARRQNAEAEIAARTLSGAPKRAPNGISGAPSRLRQWPVQIRLTSADAPYFQEADLLVAADCAAYAYASFHEDFIRDRVTLIGCPKLDEGDYTDKLAAILESNAIRSLTVVRMELPCCAGIAAAGVAAVRQSGKSIPVQVFTISLGGESAETPQTDGAS